MSDTEPPLSHSHPDTIIPFQIPEKLRAIDAQYEGLRDLDDADFALYHIAKWAHPSSLPDVIETIEREFTGPGHRSMKAAEASADRLIDLITHIDLTDERQMTDSLHDMFMGAYQAAGDSIPKIRALELVHALHLVSTAEHKITVGEADKIVRIVAAILATEDN